MNDKPVLEGHYAKLPNGYRIHYLDQGSGPVVVFLHGSGNGACGHSNFKGNYPELVAAGYRVILPDLIGFGYSDKPADVEYPLSFFVECVQQTLKQIGVARYTVVGNSLGGAVALGLALAHPREVERLVLMAPGGVSDMPDYQAMPGMAALFAHLASGKPFTHQTMKEFFIKAFVVDPACVDDQLVAERLELMKLQNPQVMKAMKIPNLTERLPEIQCPALGLWGVEEKMMPENGILRLAKGIANLRMVLVPRCGHWVMIEHRALFNRLVLDFFAQRLMALAPEKIQALGDDLFAALRARAVLEPLTAREPGIDIDDAYQISLRFLELRQSQGEKIIGKKIGVTSKPVQDMLGVHQPDFGFLLDVMRVADGSSLSLSKAKLIQPRAEGEIAFVLKKDLKGPGVTEQQVLDATDYVSPCFEIVDSRIRDWKIKIEDTVADNASCGVFVLGDARIAPRALDLAAVKMEIRKNGAHAAAGIGAAVQGHPATAVAWLANTLGRFGIPFLAGETILSGSLAPLLPAIAGDRFEMTLEGIGGASVSFAE